MTDPVENVKETFSMFSKSWSNPISKVIWLYRWKVAASLKMKKTRYHRVTKGIAPFLIYSV